MGLSQTLFQEKKINSAIFTDKNCKNAPGFQFPKLFLFSFHQSGLYRNFKKYLEIKFEINRGPWISLTKSNLGRDLQKAFPVNLPVITQRVTMAKSVLPFRELNKYFLYRWIFEIFFEFQDF